MDHDLPLLGVKRDEGTLMAPRPGFVDWSARNPSPPPLAKRSPRSSMHDSGDYARRASDW